MHPFRSSIVAFCIFTISARAETLHLLGRATLPYKMPVGTTKVGGLSGISYDSATKTFWAISDDSSYNGGAPRAYQLSLQLDRPDLKPTIKSVLILRDEKGRPFPVADCEGIAATGRGAIWVSSEGKAGKDGALPWIKLFSLANGKTVRSLPIPDEFLPAEASGRAVPMGDPAQARGVVSNRAFESCSVSPDLKTVFTANESSLVQEKFPGEGAGGASIFNPTQIRVTALDARSGKCLGEKLYISDAGCVFGSISDLCALDSHHLLVLERRLIALQQDTGSYDIRIYEIDFNQPGVTDIRPFPSVSGKQVVSLQKTLVYDSKKGGIDDLDNVEGLALVPLPGGRAGLVAVSDDNFSEKQQTQILLFELNK